MRPFFCLLLLVLLSGVCWADDLLYLGTNEQGAEEHYRVRDGAVVIRVPKGEYARRPYEGGPALEKPQPFAVDSYFIDKYEVTNAQFARFLNAVPAAAKFVDARVAGLVRTEKGWRAAAGRDRHPVTAANGNGALAYAKWVGGAIPTPPQWEKAAGGTEGRIYPWGDDAPTAKHAQGGRFRLRDTAPVGSFAAGVSPYGCHDMAGNAYDRVLMRRGGAVLPVMIKGGAWLSPHPLNLRVADMCVQDARVADRSVGFRCVMKDPTPERATRKSAAAPTLKLARTWEGAVKEARRRGVPIFLSLQFDTCGQCDRTRAQLFLDPRFVAYCNKHLVVAIGHKPAPNAVMEEHAENEDGTCPLYPSLECVDHHAIYNRAIMVVGRFVISPGNFVLDPNGAVKGAGAKSMLVRERDLPKWGNAVEQYLAMFERARKDLAQRRTTEK